MHITIAGSTAAGGAPATHNDADLALALQLQEEENERAAQARRTVHVRLLMSCCMRKGQMPT